MKNNINEIITNALNSEKINDISKESLLISQIKQTINENIELLKITNQLDIKNNNGFELDFNIVNKIIDKYITEEPLINKSDETNIMTNNILYSKVYNNLGTLLTLFDGNTYTMLEIIILSILTHNTVIFSYNGFMLGTNGLLITLIQSILEQNNYNKYMFQQTHDIRNEEYFKNFKSIDKTIIIGDNDFIIKNLKQCTTETILSGYKNYDIYIEEIIDKELINKILLQKENINFYLKNDLDLKIEDAIYVNDCDEAITKINYNSSKYASSIFTTNKENASNFIKNIKSQYAMVNTSPTIEQSLNIKQVDLLKEKIILLPDVYKK